SRLPRDQRSTTESTEIHGKENPNQLPLSMSFPGTTPARRVGSFRGYPFVMIFDLSCLSLGQLARSWSGRRLQTRPQPRSGPPGPRKGGQSKTEPNEIPVRASHLSSE